MIIDCTRACGSFLLPRSGAAAERGSAPENKKSGSLQNRITFLIYYFLLICDISLAMRIGLVITRTGMDRKKALMS
jgi:hypothetical protein